MHATTATRAGSPTRLEIGLDEDRLVKIDARAGDVLRSDAGVVWATIPGRFDDILLRPGSTHRVAADACVFLSGFGPAQATLTRPAAVPRTFAPPLRVLAEATRAWAGMCALAGLAPARP
jgi:hypothetical protein